MSKGVQLSVVTQMWKPTKPTHSPTVSLLSVKKRNFNMRWYSIYPWLTACATTKKVYCLYCRYGYFRNMLQLVKTGDKAFTSLGFNNWKKALEKFKAHELSHAHKEAKLKWIAKGKETVATQLSSQLQQEQRMRRDVLLFQLKALRFLCCQGIAIRGHHETEGNLQQLYSTEDHQSLQKWIKNEKFTCHQSVNEQISILGLSVLRKLLVKIKEMTPTWYSIIADEATDVKNTEQLNLAIRWVDSNYKVHEDSVGLLRVTDTKAETIFHVIKDLLIRCDLSLSMCRRQAYDGASNMHGRRKGVATRFKQENPAAIALHCCAHSLNLCLQDAVKNLNCIRDALETVKEISTLIRYSPKRLHLFMTKLNSPESDSGAVTLKPLCAT